MIIFLQGPPRSGKDTLARFIQAIDPEYAIRKFATEVKVGTHAYYNLFGDEVEESENYYEQVKDEPMPEFGWLTPRQAYIWYSEKYIKPSLGEDYFGVMLADRIRYEDKVVISDSGFEHEAQPIISLEKPYKIVRLVRDGTSFEKDSRSYWGIADHTIFNTSYEALLRGALECIA